MKNIIKIKQYIAFCILCTFFLSFTSCLGDLDPVVNDRIIPNNFFKDENDALAALTSIYYPFNGSWNGAIYQAGLTSYLNLANLCADDMNNTRGDYDIVEKFLWNSGTTVLSNHYPHFVKLVSQATLLIDNLENCPMNESKKKEFIGQALFARAQYCYYLYDWYGTAGVILDPEILRNPEKEVYIERQERSDFVNIIEKDLIEAAELLPVSYPAADWGRFTRGAAYTTLMKLYMQEKRWEDAEKAGREIMKLGYELQSDYYSVFSVENKRNKEMIFVVPCMAEGGYGNMWLTHIAPPEYPLKNTRIQRWYCFVTPWRFYDFYEEGDGRLKLLVGQFEYIPQGETEPVTVNRDNYVHLKKGALPIKYPEDPNQLAEFSGNDIVIYRYADVLLGMAEVLNEQHGPTQEVLDLTEMVRARAGLVNSIPASAKAGKDAFRDFILMERGRELFCEGHRRTDLIRHGRFIETAHEEGYTSAQPHMVLFPLPQNVIDESKGKIKQNPGY